MMTDAELLRRYAEEGSDVWFAEFVRRKIDLVRSAALRQVGGDAHRADDVTQIVFTETARHAASLAEHPALVGWLYTTTHFVAAKLVRSEQRRRAREEAHAQEELLAGHLTDADWERLRPVLDEVMHALSQRERQALLLRFFEKSSLSRVGAELGISENAAQKTVERTLEKLRGLLARRGITSTAAALGLVLETQTVGAAPAGLAANIAATAVLEAAGAATGAGIGGAGVLTFMGAIKPTLTGTGLIGLTALLTVSLLGVAIHEAQAARGLEAEVAAAQTTVRTSETALRERAAMAQSMTQRVAELTAKTEAQRAALAAGRAAKLREAGATSDSRGRDPRADGKAFLASLGDEERASLRQAVRLQTRQSYALNYREAGLSEAQISALEECLLPSLLDHLLVTPSGVGADPDYDELEDPAVRAALGEDGFRRLKEVSRKDAANEWVMTLAVAVNGGGAPLMSVEQMVALTTIVARHSPEYRDGGVISDATVNWGAVQAEARGVLSEAQWRQAEPWLLRREVEREITALKNQTGAR